MCGIKGNFSSSGIYYAPGQSYYDTTKRWFCTDFRPHDDTRCGDVYRGGRASLHCLSFSAAICRAYQPAMNAAKAMANSRSALVMLAYNTTALARSCDFRP